MTELVERISERYLDDYMVGRFGFNGVLEHDAYLALSRSMRRIVKKRKLPLKVVGIKGRVIVYIDEQQLTAEERAKYDVANRALIDSMLQDERPVVEWPLQWR